jgi:hypothetical protein
MLETPQSDRAQ